MVDNVAANYSTLYRVDPATNRIVARYRLDSSAGGITVGGGSVWVSMYYDNLVERIGPHGRVLAHIPVGLQPQFIDTAFGSVWVSNHHGRSVTRIDLRTNRVVDTIPAGDQRTFRNGPQGMTHDKHFEYVGSSNNSAVGFERINPRNDNTTAYLNPSAFCGPLAHAYGAVWSSDACNSTVWKINPKNGAAMRQITLPSVNDVAVVRGRLWTAFDRRIDPTSGVGSAGAVDELDARGTVVSSLRVGGDASRLGVAGGDLWVADGTNGVLTRVRVR
jgi:streptogramin lyase